MNALALGSEPGKRVAARLLGLLGEAEGIAGAADVLLLHELDLLLGGANVLLLLLLGRQLAVAVRAIAAAAGAVATGRRLAVASRLCSVATWLLRRLLLLALGGVAEEVAAVRVCVVRVGASQAAVASRSAGALLRGGRAAVAVVAIAGLGAIAASLGTVAAAASSSSTTAAVLLAGAGDGGRLLLAEAVVGARVLRRRLCVGVLARCGGVCCVLAVVALLVRGCGLHGLLCAGPFSLLRLPKRALRLPSSSAASFFLLLRKPMVAGAVWCVWCGEVRCELLGEVDCLRLRLNNGCGVSCRSLGQQHRAALWMGRLEASVVCF